MKKIALDITSLYLRQLGRTYQTGIYRYGIELAKRLSHLKDYHLHFTSIGEPLTEEYDLYHSLFHAYPPPRRMLRSSKTQTLMTFHDIIAWLYPEFYPQGSQALLQLPTYLKCQWFLAPSESTKRDLMEHFYVDENRIFVTPLAACPKLFYPHHDPDVLDRYEIPKEPYFLFVGRLEERKGIDVLLNTFYELIEQQKINSLNLVLCGPLTSSYAQIFYALAQRSPQQKNRIFHIPFARNEDLAALYSQALSLIFLSQYEGFGLPLLEAMQCGTPPICFNHSSHAEVVGTGGLLAPHQDVDFVAEKMLWLYEKPQEAQELSQRALKRAQCFSWEKTFEKTALAYQTILS